MSDEQWEASGHREPDRYYIEYVRVSLDKASTNEPLRELINERTTRGWRLVSATKGVGHDVLELVWDTLLEEFSG
jgi:hypothetical protein